MAKKPMKAIVAIKKIATKPKIKPKPKSGPKAVVKVKAPKAALKGKAGAAVMAAPQSGAVVLDRLWTVIQDRRTANPAVSHSARLLSRGVAKVAQKFGEEAVECLIEAVAGNASLVVAESADVLYHLLVLWVAAGVSPDAVWAELERREGISGVAEKAARAGPRQNGLATRKIP